MFTKRSVIAAVASIALSATVFASENLFKMDGKTYSVDDLPAKQKQTMFDIKLRHYRQLDALVNETVLKLHFAEIAKKSKKTEAEVEADLLTAKAATEKELKKFYKENKAKIPATYTYEQVKPEIKRILEGKKSNEKRDALLVKLKKKRKVKLLATEPEAPTVEIKTNGFQMKGKKGAKVKIVEFADYQCPHCGEASKAFKKVMKKYGSKVELVYVDFPVNRSGVSRVVAEGAYCASKQKKYWEFHYMAFENQSQLTNSSATEFAKKLKLKTDEFNKCLKSAEAKSYVSRGKDEGIRIGVSGTPAIYMNGKRYMGGHSDKDISDYVKKLL